MSSRGETLLTMLKTTQDLEAELANYDLKIYNALESMVEALTRELKTQRIPFFAIDKSLVEVSQAPGSGKESGKLSEAELKDLQRRMLELLEDLCKE